MIFYSCVFLWIFSGYASIGCVICIEDNINIFKSLFFDIPISIYRTLKDFPEDRLENILIICLLFLLGGILFILTLYFIYSGEVISYHEKNKNNKNYMRKHKIKKII